MDLSRLNEIKKSDHSYNTIRMISQFEFILNLASTISDETFKANIEQLINDFLEGYDIDGCCTKTRLQDLEAKFVGVSKRAKAIKIHCVGHAHIDMNWMWGYHETVDVTLKTFRTVLNLMDRFPEFTFSQSQASVYEILEKYDLELLDKIKEKIKEGRWEVTGSTWTESDKNMPSAESLLRHMIYTKSYLSELLEIEPEQLNLGYEPDTFGHPVDMPDILTQGGIKYYYFCRGKEKKGPFYWQGSNGQKVLAYQEPIWYNAKINPYDFAFFPEFLEKHGLASGLKVYGVGDHGGGPTADDIRLLMDMNTWPLMPRIVFSTYKNFYNDIEDGDYPIYKGELNPVFEGCYTSQSFIKSRQKASERKLFVCDVLSLVNDVKEEEINLRDSAWKKLLFSQFHDILTGSGTFETKSYALGQYQDVFAYTDSYIDKNLEKFANKVRASEVFSQSGLDYLVFNPTQEKRIGHIEIKVWDYDKDVNQLCIKDSSGSVLKHFVKDSSALFYWSHFYHRIEVELPLEGFGYDLIHIDQASLTNMPYINPNPVEQTMRQTRPLDLMIENDMFQLLFDKQGVLKDVIEKSTGYHYLNNQNHQGGLRFVLEDATKGMTAWNIGKYLKTNLINHSMNMRPDLFVKNSLHQQIGFEYNLNQSKLEVIYRIDMYSRVVDVAVNVDWQEIGSIQKGIPGLEYYLSHGIDSDRFFVDAHHQLFEKSLEDVDVVANQFVLIHDQNHGIGFINKDNYGYRMNNDGASIKLLRSSIDPDKYPEIGSHQFHIGLVLLDEHAKKDIYHEVNQYLYPLMAHIKRGYPGDLLSKDRLFDIRKGDVSVLSIEKTSDEIVLRVKESLGHVDNVVLIFKSLSEAYEVDIFGNDLDTLVCKENRIEFELNPNEIKTIKVKI